MAKESFELVAGHVIIEKEGRRFLLDTGSPLSFGSAGTVRLFGNTLALRPNAPPLDAMAIGRQVGNLATPRRELALDGLIGTPLFRGLALTIDWKARTVTTRSALTETRGWRGDQLGGLPSARLAINGRAVTAVPDTGARSCFADPKLLAGAPVVARTRDFYPGHGSFETTVHSVQLELGGVTKTFQVAEAPPIIVAAMNAAGAEALVGTDLMMSRGPARFVFPQQGSWLS
jgi:hypothetical protein